MNDQRAQVLATVRAALGRAEAGNDVRMAVSRRLENPHANVVPVRGRVSGRAAVEQFIAEAERVNATTDRARTWAEVPAKIGTFLKSANLPARLRVAPDPELRGIPWERGPLIRVAEGKAEDGDPVAVTGVFAGIAETGTLMLLSGPASPTTLNFLPDTHIALLPVERIVGSYEDAWVRLRARLGPGVMPRVVNWITGPSRTADIEQTLLLGAHGPRRLHIIMVAGDAGSE